MRLQLKSVAKTNNLERFISEQVELKDLPFVIQATSIYEIDEQKSIKNYPSNIIIDNRNNSSELSIHNAKKRVRALFTNPLLISMAVRDAYLMLFSATKRKTGRARRSYQFWLAKNYKDDGKNYGKSPGIIKTLAEQVSHEGIIRIVGPLTPYGRKIYWGQGQGTKRTYGRKTKRNYNASTKTVDQIKSLKGFPGVKLRSTLALHVNVMNRLSRKYPQLSIKDPWVETSLSAGKTKNPRRFPTISIGYKSKGLILNG